MVVCQDSQSMDISRIGCSYMPARGEVIMSGVSAFRVECNLTIYPLLIRLQWAYLVTVSQ